MLHILCCIFYVIILSLPKEIKNNIMNPFTVRYSSEHFCDREAEIKKLKANVTNELNTLIHSPRRLGKTALIYHLFHKLERGKKHETIFVDLFATTKMEDLIKELSEKILEKYHKKSFIEGVKSVLKGISTTISISQDGTPELSLQLTETNTVKTLNHLLKYLENRKKKVILAFDEFQEVVNYPEKAEAILRTAIQPLSNVIFLFSGSTNHLLQDMFLSPKRPFYQSTEVLVLGKIERKIYFHFIKTNFEKYSKNIETDAIDYILDFTECYTYYTQVITNQVYYQTNKTITAGEARQIINEYLETKKTDYQNLLNLLPENQKKLVISVANEEVVSKPTSMEFIMKHKLPSISSVAQAIKALAKKEILYKSPNGYTVYDLFFKRFLQRYYANNGR